MFREAEGGSRTRFGAGFPDSVERLRHPSVHKGKRRVEDVVSCEVVGLLERRSGGRGPGLDVSPWEQGTALPGGFDRARFQWERGEVVEKRCLRGRSLGGSR